MSTAAELVGIAAGAGGVGSVVAGVVYGAKWKIAHAVEAKAREAAEHLANLQEDRAAALATQRDELEAKLDAATATIADARQTIARLEALPNLERVLELVSDTFQRLGERVEELAAQSRARDNEILDVLRAIDRRAA